MSTFDYLSGRALFGLIFVVLIFSTAGYLAARYSPLYQGREKLINEIGLRVKGWWWISSIFTAALLIGFYSTLVLFSFVSFFALREYVTLSRTHAADHRALFWSFFIILPVQYYLIGINWYGLYSIFIPVYAFIFVPARLVLSGECEGFLERSAKIQWGLMLCIFFVSHIPALLTLNIPGYEGQHFKLIFFLVFLAQMSDVLQFAAGKAFGRHKIAPQTSPNKTWEGFAGGLLGTMALGYLLAGTTPFPTGPAVAMAAGIMIMGFFGGLTMSAMKRDRGVKDYGTMLPGHGGMLDRIDSLCFAAPLFFHMTRYFYTV